MPKTTILIHTPLSFVRSGWMNSENGQMDHLGSNANYWSHVIESVFYGYGLGSGYASISSSWNHIRWAGLPLGCLHVLPLNLYTVYKFKLNSPL